MRRATDVEKSEFQQSHISIHALHEESDYNPTRGKYEDSKFQSTLSMRRATIEGVEARETHDISIHALHEESDEHSAFTGIKSL